MDHRLCGIVTFVLLKLIDLVMGLRVDRDASAKAWIWHSTAKASPDASRLPSSLTTWRALPGRAIFLTVRVAAAHGAWQVADQSHRVLHEVALERRQLLHGGKAGFAREAQGQNIVGEQAIDPISNGHQRQAIKPPPGGIVLERHRIAGISPRRRRSTTISATDATSRRAKFHPWPAMGWMPRAASPTRTARCAV